MEIRQFALVIKLLCFFCRSSRLYLVRDTKSICFNLVWVNHVLITEYESWWYTFFRNDVVSTALIENWFRLHWNHNAFPFPWSNSNVNYPWILADLFLEKYLLRFYNNVRNMALSIRIKLTLVLSQQLQSFRFYHCELCEFGKFEIFWNGISLLRW